MRKTFKIMILGCILIFLLLSFTGCAQSNAINRRAIVQAIGLDWENGKFTATLEYFTPMGSGDQPIDLTSTNSEIVTGEGITVSSAISNAAFPKGKIPFYAQSSVVVIGRNLAENRLEQVADFINLDLDLRVNTEIYISDTKASDIISKDVDFGVLPGETVERIQEIYLENGLMFDVKYYRFINYFYTDYLAAGVPLLTTEIKNDEGQQEESKSEKEDESPKKTLAYLGTEIIKEKRASGNLNLEQTRGALFLTDQVHATSIDTILSDGTPLSADIISSETIITPVYLSENDITFKIQINNIINLREYKPESYQFKGTDAFNRLDQAICQIIKQECASAWNFLMKEQRADILGYGNRLRSAQPELSGWLDKNWEKTLPEVKYELNIYNQFE